MVSPKYQASIKGSQFAFCSTGQKGSWAAFKGLNPWSSHPALPDKETLQSYLLIARIPLLDKHDAPGHLVYHLVQGTCTESMSWLGSGRGSLPTKAHQPSKLQDHPNYLWGQ